MQEKGWLTRGSPRYIIISSSCHASCHASCHIIIKSTNQSTNINLLSINQPDRSEEEPAVQNERVEKERVEPEVEKELINRHAARRSLRCSKRKPTVGLDFRYGQYEKKKNKYDDSESEVAEEDEGVIYKEDKGVIYIDCDVTSWPEANVAFGHSVDNAMAVEDDAAVASVDNAMAVEDDAAVASVASVDDGDVYMEWRRRQEAGETRPLATVLQKKRVGRGKNPSPSQLKYRLAHSFWKNKNK